MRKAEKRRLGLEKRERMLEAEKLIGLQALQEDRTRRAEQQANPFPAQTKKASRGIKASRVESDGKVNVRR